MKRMKSWSILVILTLMVGLLSACGGGKEEASPQSSEGTESVQNNGELQGKLVIWSFFDQVKEMANKFMEKHPGVEVDVKLFPGDQYQTKLQTALQTGSDAPDIFDLERSYVGKFVNSPFVEDLSKMGADELLKDYVPYVAALGKDENGAIKAISDHSSPGGFWYNREQAKKYLGTDDPLEVSEMLSSWDKIIELGKKVVEESDGKVHLLTNTEDVIFFNQYHNEPWVKDGKFNYDPKWNDVLNIQREIRESGVDAKLGYFTPGWGNALNDGSVIAIAMPAWAGFMVDNKDDQAIGKYGIAMGPEGYYMGGTYRSIYSKSQNKELAYEFIKFVASEEWQDYNLQKTGNMPALKTVYEKNMDSFKMEYTGDQNILRMYYDISMSIPATIPDKYSEDIQKIFVKQSLEAIDNNGTNEEVYENVTKQVKSDYPELGVE